MNRQKLKVGNGMKQCKGSITRTRTTINGTEESSIDVVLFSEDLADLVEEIVIDTERKHSITKLSKTSNVESDHKTMITILKLNWNPQIIPQKISIFNLKNKECLKSFLKNTSNNNNLSKKMDEEEDLDKATNKLMNKFNKVLHKCFRNIGVKEGTKTTNKEDLYNKWKGIKTKLTKKV